MADKKKSGISVMPEFVDGEQPSAQKFNSIGAQVKASDYNLEVSIGDIWDESYPYSAISNKSLSLNKISSLGTEYIDINSNGKRLDVASLGRIIGPASNLNPLTLGYDENGSLLKTIVNEQIRSTLGNQYTFKYLPAATGSINFSNSTIFANPVTSTNLLNSGSAGDYYIDLAKGTVHTYSQINANCTVTYKTAPKNYEGGGAPLGASYNVIPDPAQINGSGNQLTITLESDGSYMVVLPTITHEASNRGGSTTTVNTNRDINAGVRLTLPIAVILACSSGNYTQQIGTDTGIPGTIIPEGILYLRNETTLELYTEATYYYVNNTSFKIKVSETLDLANDKFTVITIGNNITSCIQDLYRKQFFHSHNREFGELPIKVESLADNYEYSGESGSFIPSNVNNNYFSQYLHRDGSRGNDVGLNDDNAIRGNLVIGRARDTAGNDITEAGNYLGEGSTFFLNFGRNTTGTSRIGRFYNTSTNEGLLQIQSGSNSSIQAFSPLKVELLGQGNGFGIDLHAPSGTIRSRAGDNFTIDSGAMVEITANTDNGTGYIKNVGGTSLQHSNSGTTSINSVSGWHHPKMSCLVFRDHGRRWVAREFPGGNPQSSQHSNNIIDTSFKLPYDISELDSLRIHDVRVFVRGSNLNPNDDSLVSDIGSYLGITSGDYGSSEATEYDWIEISSCHPVMASYSFFTVLPSGPPAAGAYMHREATPFTERSGVINAVIPLDVNGLAGGRGPTHFDSADLTYQGRWEMQLDTKVLVWYSIV